LTNLKRYVAILVTFIHVSLYSLTNNFSYPTSTPTGTSPDLSQTGDNAYYPEIATSSGRYAYAIWYRYFGAQAKVQVAISSDYGNTWQDPDSTPTGTPPNLSQFGPGFLVPQIATDSSGRYVYAVWYIGSTIQAAISSDFGHSWQDPVSTPGGSPNLSQPGDSNIPQIATDSSGRYVYAVWHMKDASNYLRIQVAISSDYGNTWQDPGSTPTGIPPNLSQPNQNANNPQIATDNSGRYVYALWQRSDGSNSRIQVAISSDYGNTWQNPSSTPTGTSPDLSQANQNATIPQIATDSSGKHVYAIWPRNDGSRLRIQVAISSDYGNNWQDPDSTPTGIPPNLSQPNQNANNPQIATDNSGRYVYALWQRSDGSNSRIQVAISSDYGYSFQSPGSTPTRTPPDLSEVGLTARTVQVSTDSSGRYVYVIWKIDLDNNSKDIVQVALSNDFGNSWQYPDSTTEGSPDLSQSGLNTNRIKVVTDSSGKYTYAVWEINDGTYSLIQISIGLRSYFPLKGMLIR
jgi:BNR repeat-like domain